MTRAERIKSLKNAIVELEKLVHELELEEKLQLWYEEAAELKREFPNFNIREEAQKNREFCELLAGGASVRDAYLRGAHHDTG